MLCRYEARANAYFEIVMSDYYNCPFKLMKSDHKISLYLLYYNLQNVLNLFIEKIRPMRASVCVCIYIYKFMSICLYIYYKLIRMLHRLV